MTIKGRSYKQLQNFTFSPTIHRCRWDDEYYHVAIQHFIPRVVYGLVLNKSDIDVELLT